MTLPLLGPMTLSGFAHPWFFLFLLIIAGLVGLYVVVQFARQTPGAALREHGAAGKRCAQTPEPLAASVRRSC